jgi:16S rRNA (guanine966-N2)-methyltransferase
VRPATDRSREALGSALGDRLVGSTVVDLFAGTGAYGLEALSRGAASVTLIEQQPGLRKLIQSNVAAVRRSCEAAGGDVGSVQVRIADVLKLAPEPRADGVFADPPYALVRTHPEAFVAAVFGWLRPESGAWAAIEAPGDWEIPLLPSDIRLERRLGKPGPDHPSLFLFVRG